ncbi:catechol 2,3-dioxygenase-like lactoylglutathione lyase family enzyme [Labrenzia sp. EL_208]|uniref:VOC family protein n=1 Tax=Roseibium album TaxID=311410 RepID=UPI0018CB426B|nr:catechol 2,3-dioxygenase-like lactoylglutathione lyase family enzyme [Labrenzia sp. EL_162]MBG6176563.1 catechol 2,3-dioxygenase-like lactoylglutathione lyase family enzyme [Labrenzia sp. EL_132]MBG6198329.1 catechol 2,3-dioxygenase-like lactoylglutathione lyase family enzyme [Labrenzia sp. EL_159]MBG6201949.1 catechol 2,3-dioxygenase-like lactoylglutathione lyase family enzyme [Labrenzia sp. EL_13]MBG6230967.1 catechol 2,3-dioxygenase-like lactoylglutathione lyase family enzyme [Labrenzia s
MTQTAVQAAAYLHHLALESSTPSHLAEFYSDAMDMGLAKISDAEWRCEGPGRRMIIVAGEDKKLSFAGMACRNADGLAALRARAGSEGLEILQSPSPYFGDDAFAVRDPNGHLICFGLAKPDTIARKGIQGPTQHLTFASNDVSAFVDFYCGKLGFSLVDRVLHDNGDLATAFTTSNHEHHTIACFKSDRNGIDHHSYEAGDWNYIRDWCDHFADRDIQLMWGPGRHGPGNNLFIFIEDPDGNWIEVSAELEVIYDRQVVDWPQHPRTLNKWGRAILRS